MAIPVLILPWLTARNDEAVNTVDAFGPLARSRLEAGCFFVPWMEADVTCRLSRETFFFPKNFELK